MLNNTTNDAELMNQAIETWLTANGRYDGWAWIRLIDAVNSRVEANWRAVHFDMFRKGN